MQLESRKYLFDIQKAGALLIQFSAGKTLADYEADALLRSGIERQFEIIGEALSQLLKRSPELAGCFTDSKRIIAFRNILAHGYVVVSNEVVWGILQSNLPLLHAEVEKLLQGP